jgi:hypothetical protein
VSVLTVLSYTARCTRSDMMNHDRVVPATPPLEEREHHNITIRCHSVNARSSKTRRTGPKANHKMRACLGMPGTDVLRERLCYREKFAARFVPGPSPSPSSIRGRGRVPRDRRSVRQAVRRRHFGVALSTNQLSVFNVFGRGAS